MKSKLYADIYLKDISITLGLMYDKMDKWEQEGRLPRKA
jgi:hypothetical protein